MCITSKAIMFRHTSSRLYGVGLKSRSGTASRSRSGSGCSDEKSGVDVVDSRNSSFSSFSKSYFTTVIASSSLSCPALPCHHLLNCAGNLAIGCYADVVD
ncbi:hypothetical protein TYRP_009145, partial [Tyrophagus putrescentiae]